MSDHAIAQMSIADVGHDSHEAIADTAATASTSLCFAALCVLTGGSFFTYFSLLAVRARARQASGVDDGHFLHEGHAGDHVFHALAVGSQLEVGAHDPGHVHVDVPDADARARYRLAAKQRICALFAGAFAVRPRSAQIEAAELKAAEKELSHARALTSRRIRHVYFACR